MESKNSMGFSISISSVWTLEFCVRASSLTITIYTTTITIILYYELASTCWLNKVVAALDNATSKVDSSSKRPVYSTNRRWSYHSKAKALEEMRWGRKTIFIQ